MIRLANDRFELGAYAAYVAAYAIAALVALALAGCPGDKRKHAPPPAAPRKRVQLDPVVDYVPLAEREQAARPEPAPVASDSNGGAGGPGVTLQDPFTSPIRYAIHYTPRGLGPVYVPQWLENQPALPNVVAELLEELDKTTPERGSKPAGDYPELLGVEIWIWGGGASFAPADWSPTGIVAGAQQPGRVLVCWKDHAKVIPNDPFPNRRLPAWRHEAAHQLGLIGDD